MMLPCLCFFTNGSDVHCSCPVLPNRGSANGAPAGGAFLADILTEAVAEVRGPDELRLLIFPQPLDGALKNQNAAPASPPCFRRRRRSAPLLFESTRLCEADICAKENRQCISTPAVFSWARVDYASRASKKAPQGPFCRRDV